MVQIKKEEEQWLISTFENCVNQETLGGVSVQRWFNDWFE